MKKLVKFMAVAILAVVSAVACKKDQSSSTPVLKADVSDLKIDSNGTAVTFNIESNIEWEIESSAEWLVVSPKSGSGNAQINVSASKSTEARTATIQINATKVNLTPVKVKVSQDAPAGADISVAPTELSFKADGSESKTVKVTCSGAWTATASADAVEINPASGNGNADVTVKLAKNIKGSVVNYDVTFTSGSKEAKVAISQEASEDAPGGSGTEASPYTIANAKQWMTVINDWKDTKGINFAREAHYKVINDIDFAGVQLFTPDTLRGSFDGQNHKLYNISISGKDATTGFFGVVTASSFKDVIFGSKDGTTYDGVSKISYTGEASGWYYISTVARLECNAENIKSFVNIEVAPESLSKVRVAGLFARVLGTDVSIKNCINYGNVACLNSGKTANQECLVGGVVATFEDSGVGHVENCENYGSVKSADPYTTALGGVVGNCPKNKLVVMKGCKNYGLVDINTTETPDSYKEAYVGGIAGLLNTDADAAGNNLLEECVNYANLTITGISVGNAGGIAGRIPGCKYVKCINEGNVTFDGNVAGKALLIGGIAGGMYYGGTVEGCVNNGDITSNKNQNCRIGGIIGTVNSGDVTIKSCVNEGAISYKRADFNNNWQAVGGIVGFQEKSTTIVLDGNTNKGAVSIDANNTTEHASQRLNAGGIVGASILNLELKNNVNEGNVSIKNSGYTDGFAGGLVGLLLTNAKSSAGNQTKGSVSVSVTGAKPESSKSTGTQNAGGAFGANKVAAFTSTGDSSNATVTCDAGFETVGSFIGFNAGTITGASVAGTVKGEAASATNAQGTSSTGTITLK